MKTQVLNNEIADRVNQVIYDFGVEFGNSADISLFGFFNENYVKSLDIISQESSYDWEKKEYVDQYNDGDSGDSFSGHIYHEVSKGVWAGFIFYC